MQLWSMILTEPIRVGSGWSAATGLKYHNKTGVYCDKSAALAALRPNKRAVALEAVSRQACAPFARPRQILVK